MSPLTKTLAQNKKATKLVRLAQRKNGPKSYRHGQGALLRVLLENDIVTQHDLVIALGCNRSEVKGVVKKAVRNGYVTIVDDEAPKTYRVVLTDEGRAIAEKREQANDRASEEILSCLSPEEIEQLDAINEKLIVSLKEQGIDGKKKGYRARRRNAHRHRTYTAR